MKEIKAARLVLAVAGVLIAGGLARAQMPGGQGMSPGFTQHRPPIEQSFGFAHGQFWNNPNMVKRLNLTDVQRKAMDGILQDHRMKLIDLHANLQKAEVELEPMIKADTPDRKTIEAQIDKIVTARADLEKADSLFLLDIRMQLTPDQWKQLQALRAQRMEREQRHAADPGGWEPGNKFHGPGGPLPQPAPGGQPPANAPQSAPSPAPESGTPQ